MKVLPCRADLQNDGPRQASNIDREKKKPRKCFSHASAKCCLLMIVASSWYADCCCFNLLWHLLYSPWCSSITVHSVFAFEYISCPCCALWELLGAIFHLVNLHCPHYLHWHYVAFMKILVSFKNLFQFHKILHVLWFLFVSIDALNFLCAF